VLHEATSHGPTLLPCKSSPAQGYKGYDFKVCFSIWTSAQLIWSELFILNDYLLESITVTWDLWNIWGDLFRFKSSYRQQWHFEACRFWTCEVFFQRPKWSTTDESGDHSLVQVGLWCPIPASDLVNHSRLWISWVQRFCFLTEHSNGCSYHVQWTATSKSLDFLVLLPVSGPPSCWWAPQSTLQPWTCGQWDAFLLSFLTESPSFPEGTRCG